MSTSVVGILFLILGLLEGHVDSSSDYIHVGEGTLLTQDKQQYYAVVQYDGVGDSLDAVHNVMKKTCSSLSSSCVGYHVNEDPDEKQYLTAAFLHDISFLSEDAFPPSLSDDFPSGARVAWKIAEFNGGVWAGTGLPNADTASKAAGKGWNTWQAYRRVAFVPPVLATEFGLRRASNYVEVGEGTLLTEDLSQYYAVTQYKWDDKDATEVQIAVESECDARPSCVGYHIYLTLKGGRYKEAALLHDVSLYPEETWPPEPPAGATQTWKAAEWKEGALWGGTGKPNSETASASAGKGWNGWTAFRQLSKAEIAASPHGVVTGDTATGTVVTVPDPIEYVHLGEGTLVTQDQKQYYPLVQYSGVGDTINDVHTHMRSACTTLRSCVGYHVSEDEGLGQHLHAAFLHDFALVSRSNFPPALPSHFPSSATVVWTGVDWSSTDGLWSGSGQPYKDSASQAVGMGWDSWQAYLKTGGPSQNPETAVETKAAAEPSVHQGLTWTTVASAGTVLPSRVMCVGGFVVTILWALCLV
eukprot:GFYU01001388.1.p1 GENE.GFYU01001388.1~~GFYU01001388.1.p1  ORF type:complete len:528 (+),score=89.39 GFYU01001388.1:133-1716(+)